VKRKRAASAISGGIFIISLGVLLMTGWWWPGIMIAIGLSSGAELIFRGRIMQGISTLAFFCGIPLVIAVVQRTDIPWTVVGGLFLVGGGVITLVKAFFLRD
jgi:hypothetical protein